VDELEKELKVESSWSIELENELKDKWEANAKLQGELITEVEKHSFHREESAVVHCDLEGTHAELRGMMNNNEAYLVDAVAALEDLMIERG
jgi:hypothetical protein